eukprot:scaffold204856_cov28-Prasinocladus_malaysianus.AAC.1
MHQSVKRNVTRYYFNSFRFASVFICFASFRFNPPFHFIAFHFQSWPAPSLALRPESHAKSNRLMHVARAHPKS